MPKSTPADLAVAFRSIPRRLKEASAEHVPAAAVARAEAAVASAVSAAAATLGCAPTADAVAAEIQARKPTTWSDADLGAIQNHANEAARAIRDLQDS